MDGLVTVTRLRAADAGLRSRSSRRSHRGGLRSHRCAHRAIARCASRRPLVAGRQRREEIGGGKVRPHQTAIVVGRTKQIVADFMRDHPCEHARHEPVAHRGRPGESRRTSARAADDIFRSERRDANRVAPDMTIHRADCTERLQSGAGRGAGNGRPVDANHDLWPARSVRLEPAQDDASAIPDA